MFAKLAFKNIQRSLKDYAIYFFTLVLAVAIFYVFNSLDSQSVMLNVTERVREMIDLVNVIMGIVSVFVSAILGGLIIYASRFLIKRRSKEFGIYLTLGMSKRKISLILLIETFLIGLLSLGVGLVLGVIASQFMSVIVANMFDADMTNFHFAVSLSAILQTLLYFGIIYAVVMVFNTVIVSRQKLINLLSSSRRNEKISLKNPWLCTVVFVVAAALLGWAYYLVTDGLTTLQEPKDLLKPIAMGVVATFLLFWSLSGLLLRIFMSFKKIYYNKLNSFVLRQFSSQINTTVVSMSLICLMLFVTICVLGSALSINVNLHRTIEQALPVDVQVSSIGREAVSIEQIYRQEGINLDELLKDVTTYYQYTVPDFYMSDSLSSSALTVDDAGSDGSIIIDSYNTVSQPIVHVGDYNRVAELFHLPVIELERNEYAAVANFRQIAEMRDKSMAAGQEIQLMGRKLSPKFDHCIEGTLELEMANMNSGIIIIPDDLKIKTDNYVYRQEILLANFADPDRAAEIEAELYRLNNRFFSEDPDGDTEPGSSENPVLYYYDVNSKQDIIDNNVGTSAMVTFIGLYIGIIFLISSAAVLALKELSESSDNRDKYSVLRKLGASNSLLNRALFWQIFIFFVFPLFIAIIHSIFGLMFCDFVLATFGGINIFETLPWVSALLLGIYGGYFVITYFCSRNMIRERRN